MIFFLKLNILAQWFAKGNLENLLKQKEDIFELF
jgi:hypothetical protein